MRDEQLDDLQQRQPSLRSIQHTLCLTNDRLYREFYAYLEDLMVKHNLIAMDFRSSFQRYTKHNDVIKLVTSSIQAVDHFGDTVRSLQTDPGQRACKLLVHKIRSNHRRRRHGRLATDTKDVSKRPTKAGVTPIASLPCVHNEELEHSRSTSPDRVYASESIRDLCHGMISILRPGGTLKAVCRPSELMLQQHGDPRVGALDWRTFLAILESEHSLCTSTEYITWEGGEEQINGSIDNERQWKAVLLHQLAREQPLTFIIMHRADGILGT